MGLGDGGGGVGAAIGCVDSVVIFDEPTPEEIVEALSPDVLAKGADWADKGVVGREHVESIGGRVELVPLVEGVSTTTIVERTPSGGPQKTIPRPISTT